MHNNTADVQIRYFGNSEIQSRISETRAPALKLRKTIFACARNSECFGIEKPPKKYLPIRSSNNIGWRERFMIHVPI